MQYARVTFRTDAAATPGWEATLRSLSACRKIIDSPIENHRGRFINSAGDSVLAEFMKSKDGSPNRFDTPDLKEAELLLDDLAR